MRLVLQTFKEQQRWDNRGPYSFQRIKAWAIDGVPLASYGYPVKPCGLIVYTFRPSDDCTLFPFLILSNMFAIEVLGYFATLFVLLELQDNTMVAQAKALQQVKTRLQETRYDQPSYIW